eukprot:XP_001700994.1 predicted protein [Chlamydomonas reinhardtii]
MSQRSLVDLYSRLVKTGFGSNCTFLDVGSGLGSPTLTPLTTTTNSSAAVLPMPENGDTTSHLHVPATAPLTPPVHPPTQPEYGTVAMLAQLVMSCVPLALNDICKSEYSRLTEQIPADHNYHELENLLAPERGQGEGPVGPASQASPVPKSSGLGSAQSFRGLQSFKHLLQHLGGASREGGPAPQAEGEAQQQLAQFVKQLGGGASEVSFVTAAEDGLLSRERVLAKLTKLFKQSAAPVVLVAYSGPSDERGNWCFAGQASASGASGSASAAGSLPYSGSHGAPSSPTTGGGAVGSSVSSCVVSFREVSMLWQRHRKHSQRLVLLLDCANSGYWVSALRLLSKAEQLELSLGVQASDCSAPAVADRQLTYMPGIFTQLFLSNNNYYATWLNDSLVDYGIALRFFNCNVRAESRRRREGWAAMSMRAVSVPDAARRRFSSLADYYQPQRPPGMHGAMLPGEQPGDESAQYGYTGESGSLLTADMEAAALSEGPPAP